MPFSDGVWYDPQNKLFKMWYMGGYLLNRCYATSQDGIHWEKPTLNRVDFEGSTANNLVWHATGNNMSPFRDPNPGVPDDERYKAIVRHQAVFEKTGGLHASGLFDSTGEILAVREDVGRHNALDKLIGRSLLSDQLPLSEFGIVVSGRASFELMQKAMMAGLPLLAAVGAPSSLAVELAEEFGMTLIGFLKRNKLNIYTRPDRVQ